jgi:hypothetical protein
VVTDTDTDSDVVFGPLELLGISHRPALADLLDQKGWRVSASADYEPLNTFARGRIDTAKIRRNWEDILRVVASIYTGIVYAYDVVTMLQRDGHPHRARRGHRDVRADLQGHPQPPGRPPRTRPEEPRCARAAPARRRSAQRPFASRG